MASRQTAHGYFETVTGGVLHYLRTGAERARKPPLLCLPGSQDPASALLPIVEEVAGEREVFLLDWRGQGDSSPLADGCYDAGTLLWDLTAFAEALLPPRFALLGHCLGAQIAACWAGLSPDRVERLVLIEGLSIPAPPGAWVAELRRWIERARKAEQDGLPKPRTLDDLGAAAEILEKSHPELSPEERLEAARELTRTRPDGLLEWRHAPDLSVRSAPLPFARDVLEALWREIAAPALWLTSAAALAAPPLQPGPVERDRASLERAARSIAACFRSIEWHLLDAEAPGMHRAKRAEVAAHVARFLRPE